jgi:hypothetical protein
MRAIARGSGKWGDPNVPKTGWEPNGVIDHGEPCVICEMCEYMHIRYEHQMRHRYYPKLLGCGCICSGHMSDDLTGAATRQREATNTSKRIKAKAKRDRLEAEAKDRRQRQRDEAAAAWEADAPAREAAQQANDARHAAMSETAARIQAAYLFERSLMLHWQISKNGNWWAVGREGWRATVCRDHRTRRWKFVFSQANDSVWNPALYDDVDEAKEIAARMFREVMETTQ